MLEQREISAILELAESRSVTRAAERLNISIASLSRHVSRAEAHLGMTLFRRDRSGSHPTREGRLALPLIRNMKRSIDRTERKLADVRTRSAGTLRIGCGPLTTRTIVAPVLSGSMMAAAFSTRNLAMMFDPWTPNLESST